jgi:hypothetical protein
VGFEANAGACSPVRVLREQARDPGIEEEARDGFGGGGRHVQEERCPRRRIDRHVSGSIDAPERAVNRAAVDALEPAP